MPGVAGQEGSLVRGLLTEFRTFVLRGNVQRGRPGGGIVVGVAFAAVVQALVKDLLTPLIAAIVGQADFSALTFRVNRSVFRYGDFLNAVIAFLTIAAAIFFVVVKPITTLTGHFSHRGTPEPTTRKCPYCLMGISVMARRCAFCTTELGAARDLPVFPARRHGALPARMPSLDPSAPARYPARDCCIRGGRLRAARLSA
jgi:large conductance mechanosensitive channel